MEIYALNTKVRAGIVGLRVLIEKTPRSLEMDRFQFIDLFPKIYLSQNLRELSPHLPLYGVAYLDNITVTQFTTLNSIEEALDCVKNISIIQQDDDFDNDDAFNPTTTSTPVKKRLTYGNDPKNVTAKGKQTKPATITRAQDSDAEMDEQNNNIPIGNGKQSSATKADNQADENETADLMEKLGVATPTK